MLRNTKKMIKATGDQILILPDAPLERTESGVLIPVEARDKRNSGVVVSGSCVICEEDEEGRSDMSLITPVVYLHNRVMSGDRVVFNYRRGYEVEHEGVTYLSIAKEYILMKL